MSAAFAARLTRQPIAFDREAAADVGAAFSDLTPEVSGLLAATAGCSPYLRGLMGRETAWLRDALAGAPETAMQHVLTALSDVETPELGAALRQAKRRVALLSALCDLGGVWRLEEVTGTLTRLADRAIDLCLKRLVADEIRRGKLPGAMPGDEATAAGMVVLAMGKMGAAELNYSSDIDLICLFDDERYGDDAGDARAAFIRVTRKTAALLSEVTDEGYVFRTDLRLRPDASVTPVCISISAAEAYYEAEGRTWERAAYIKARPCAGDIVAGERFLATLTPFVWRRHLDFTAIQDAYDMRLRIRDHRGLHGPLTVEGHDMKLGLGGIREIEFFTQTRQLIAGGRDPALRDRTTEGGLAALAAKGWIPQAVGEELTGLYRAHREVEHRLQMVNDAQTHTMPTTPEGVARIAAFCGETEVAFRAQLLARLARTDELTEGFFAPGETEEQPRLSDQAEAIIAGWRAYPCLRSERAQTIFRRLGPQLLKRLTRATNQTEALVALDGFLAGLPAGVQIFSLFEANPSLVDLIIDIAGTAPALARYLSRNAHVLDAVIGGSFWEPWPGVAGLTTALGKALAGARDYEAQLDAARLWMKEWHFRIGVHHLRGLIDAFEAGKSYADLAEAVIRGVWPVVTGAFVRRHGPLPGRGAVLLGMGSLGAARLNAESDLDLILIYDAAGIEVSDGAKPLPVRTYYARLTQAMVTALAAQTAEGRLYEVDVRLRPSGRAGAVATSVESWKSYQATEAWTWEHLALTRARVMVGAKDLAAEVEIFRRHIIAEKGRGPKVLADLSEMRRRLAAAKPPEGLWEAKNGPGRIMDIELCAELLALRSRSPVRGVEAQVLAGKMLMAASDRDAMMAAYRLLWRVYCAGRLLTARTLDPGALGEGGCAFVLRETGAASAEELAEMIARRVALAEAAILRQLEEGSDGETCGGIE
jgi:glutamate-ammonia-ligase adenylyltransferase